MNLMCLMLNPPAPPPPPPPIDRSVTAPFADHQPTSFALYRQDNWIAFNEQELVSDMPAGLRADVITHTHMNTISQIPWLESKDKVFKADVAITLKPRLFMVGWLLCWWRQIGRHGYFWGALRVPELNYRDRERHDCGLVGPELPVG